MPLPAATGYSWREERAEMQMKSVTICMSGQLDHFDPVMWPHTHLNYNEERGQDGKQHIEPKKDQESQHYLTIGKSHVVHCRQDKENGGSLQLILFVWHACFQCTNGSSGSYNVMVKWQRNSLQHYDILPLEQGSKWNTTTYLYIILII